MSGDVQQVENGTWTFRRVVIGAGNKTVAEALMWTAPNGGYPRVDNVDEQDANAHLIAAAPELLTALRGLIGLHDDPTPYDSATTISAARVAIAKAEGRS